MLNFNRILTTIKNLTTYVLYTEMRIGCEYPKIEMKAKLRWVGRQSDKFKKPSGFLQRSLILAVPDVRGRISKFLF